MGRWERKRSRRHVKQQVTEPVVPEGVVVRAEAFRTKADVKFRVALTTTVPVQGKAAYEHTGNTQSSTCPRLHQIAGACNKEAPNSHAPAPSEKTPP